MPPHLQFGLSLPRATASLPRASLSLLRSCLYLFRATALVPLLALLFATTANATTVQRVDVDYLIVNARLIFEGVVIARESHWNQNRSSIYTLVTFRVNDVIKGDHPASTIVIRYAGGVVDGKGISVSAMVYPRLGEHGIYFMENPLRNLVNPMVGWGQGHFIIAPDASGTQRVHTESGMPVLELEIPSLLSGLSEAAERMQFSHGTAKGVRVGSKATAISSALEKSTFKQHLRQRLSAPRPSPNQSN